MNKAQWHAKIKKAMEGVGCFNSSYNTTIDILASILEVRDAQMKEFKKDGSMAVVEHTNQGGATNLDINPSFKVIQQCNSLALQYLAQLGLTPRALKSVGGESKEQSNDKVTEWLKKIGV